MKKKLSILLASLMVVSGLVGCGGSTETTSTSTSTDEEATEEVATATGLITVITREDGSGTRGAFTEITGVLADDVDMTTVDAVAMDSTGKVITAVSEDPKGFGYISLGSLNDTVKAIEVDGVAPSVETILDGSYKVARPFNIATKKGAELSEVAAELLAFCFTQEVQDLAAEQGCVPVEVTTAEFTSAQPSGTITVGGSTSVYPLMEKIVEAYKEINPNATINLEGVGSSSGMNGASEGTFDIGMASREMKDSELEVLDGYVLAMDGIAVIVNNENPINGLTMEQIRDIYTGEIMTYDELN